MNVFEEIRKEYESRGLNRDDLHADPLQQFDVWFRQAVEKAPGKWIEPNAMTISTCVNNFVTSRTVLLKEYQQGQFVFFTNYASEKGTQLLANPQAAMLFHWPYLGRQIRINGTVAKTTREHSERYFHSRPRGSQIGAYASQQSSELQSREQLDQLRQELDKQFVDSEIPLPETWGGFALQPTRFEFWQGRLDRLHDRFVYSRKNEQVDDAWQIKRLSP